MRATSLICVCSAAVSSTGLMLSFSLLRSWPAWKCLRKVLPLPSGSPVQLRHHQQQHQQGCLAFRHCSNSLQGQHPTLQLEHSRIWCLASRTTAHSTGCTRLCMRPSSSMQQTLLEACAVHATFKYLCWAVTTFC